MCIALLGEMEIYVLAGSLLAIAIAVWQGISSHRKHLRFAGEKNKEGPVTYDLAVRYALSAGWSIEAEISSGIQLKGRTKIIPPGARICLILGFLALPIYGAGLILLIIAFIGYSQAPVHSFFITRESPKFPTLNP